MQASLAIVALVGASYAPGLLPEPRPRTELSEEIHTYELKAHVYRLASPEFLGRRGPRARPEPPRHIARTAFERLKLQPLFDDNKSYFQPIPSLSKDKETEQGRSRRPATSGAVLPGTDPGS